MLATDVSELSAVEAVAFWGFMIGSAIVVLYFLVILFGGES